MKAEKDTSNTNLEAQNEQPEIYALTQGKEGWQFSRREFLAASAAAGAALAAGCSPSTPEPTATPTLGVEQNEIANACNLKQIQSHTDSACALAINPNGTLLVSGGGLDDRKIKFWSLPNGELLHTLDGHTSLVNALAISPDGSLLASGSWDETIKLWSLPNGELLKTLKGHTRNIYTLAISPDGTMLVSGSADDTIKFWSLPHGELIQTLEGHSSWITALAINPVGNLLVSGGWDGTVKLWSFPDGKLLKTRTGHSSLVNAITISPDGTMAASGGNDAKIRLWSLPKGRGLFTKLQEHTGTVSSLVINSDSNLLISGSLDCTIKLWTLPNGDFIRTLGTLEPDIEETSTDTDRAEIKTLAISPDGTLLISGTKDGRLKMWSLPEGQLKGCLIDLSIIPSDVELTTYETTNSSGEISTYTLPVGAPIPAGAVCTCNTVVGSGCNCVGHTSSSGFGHYWYPT